MDKAIVVKNVSKKYKLYTNTKERFLDLVSPKEYGEEFYALSKVNFEANYGEVVGFVGINGSGKSTLSNIIAGIVPETSGTIEVNGEVSLIAVAAGLKNDLTGRDNIELKLLMLGFNKDQIKLLEQEIIEFAELEEFIDQPVKSYSSGMKSRLGFAISVNIDPEILIIDEALSVGDKAFAEKSLAKMREFKEEGKTMIFVSHSIGQMKKFCDKILWLEFGMVKGYGAVEDMVPKYEEFLEMWKGLSKGERNEYRIHANKKTLDYEAFLQKSRQNNGDYKEQPTSRMGRIGSGGYYIYKTPRDLSDYQLSKKFINNTYFIKKQASIDGERFYLLSHEPSAVKGIVGWMKSTDVKVHDLTHIERDSKFFQLLGTGHAYDRPWGSQDNQIYSDLKPLKGEDFYVERTDRVRKGHWYYGTLKGKKVWIYQSRLTEVKK